MRKKFLYLVFLGSILYQGSQVHGSDVAAQYLRNVGTPPSLDLKNCGQVCNDATCATDLDSKAYRCFKGCSNNTAVTKMITCANAQFKSFIQDLRAQINRLQQANDQQGQQINDLESQIHDLESQLQAAQEAFDQNRGRLNSAADNNRQLRAQIDALQEELRNETERQVRLRQENGNLRTQLDLANRNTEEKDIHIGDLNRLIEDNQRELDDAFEAMQALKEQFDMFVRGVSGITGLFREHAEGIRLANSQLKEQIKAMKKFIKEHDEEVIPFIQQKGEEFDQLILDAQADLIILQDFINGCKADVERAREALDQVNLRAQQSLNK